MPIDSCLISKTQDTRDRMLSDVWNWIWRTRRLLTRNLWRSSFADMTVGTVRQKRFLNFDVEKSMRWFKSFWVDGSIRTMLSAKIFCIHDRTKEVKRVRAATLHVFCVMVKLVYWSKSSNKWLGANSFANTVPTTDGSTLSRKRKRAIQGKRERWFFIQDISADAEWNIDFLISFARSQIRVREDREQMRSCFLTTRNSSILTCMYHILKIYSQTVLKIIWFRLWKKNHIHKEKRIKSIILKCWQDQDQEGFQINLKREITIS